MRMAVFLHQELPVRFARSTNQLDSLELVQGIKSINTVRDWYAQSFKVRKERDKDRSIYTTVSSYVLCLPPCTGVGLEINGFSFCIYLLWFVCMLCRIFVRRRCRIH